MLRKALFYNPVLSVAILLSPVVVISAGYFAWSDTNSTPGEVAAIVTVRAISPQRVAVRRTCTQPGTIHAFYEAKLYARVSGYLRELRVDIGDTVDAGQPLAVLDVPEMDKKVERLQAELLRAQCEQVRARADRDVASAQVESQRSQMALCEAELTRVQQLVKKQALTDQIRDESEHHLATAKAALHVAEAKLKAAAAEVEVAAARALSAQKELEEANAWRSYATLRAPFPGVINGRNVDLGDLVKSSDGHGHGVALFTIAKIDTVRLRVAVPERDVPWVAVGKKAEFRASSLPSQAFAGTITRLTSSLDPNTRTMGVEVDLANPGHRLLPGMFGHTTIVLEERADRLSLPTQAVHFEKAAKGYVLVVTSDSTVARVDVVTGQDDGQRIEILEGLVGHEQVIISQHAGLAAGQRVQHAQEQ